MYEYLEGEITGRSPAGRVLEAAGVGYYLCVPLGSRIPGEGRARVWTHFVVRETEQKLYGFESRATRELFRFLLCVRGVGPAMALAILSGLPAADLLEALRSEDAASLTRAKGVGKKTAAQILLDLRDKVEHLSAELGGAAAPEGGAAAGGRPSGFEDAVQALVAIGYKEKEARASIERAAQEVDSEDLETLVRTALRG